MRCPGLDGWMVGSMLKCYLNKVLKRREESFSICFTIQIRNFDTKQKTEKKQTIHKTSSLSNNPFKNSHTQKFHRTNANRNQTSFICSNSRNKAKAPRY